MEIIRTKGNEEITCETELFINQNFNIQQCSYNL